MKKRALPYRTAGGDCDNSDMTSCPAFGMREDEYVYVGGRKMKTYSCYVLIAVRACIASGTVIQDGSTINIHHDMVRQTEDEASEE